MERGSTLATILADMTGRMITAWLVALALPALAGWLIAFSEYPNIGWIIAAVAAVYVIVLFILNKPGPDARHPEPEKIELVSDEGQQMLVRGTSMHLRDMKYRYSIRFDRGGEREPFTAEVNTIILGFLPVIILDNKTDRQGRGYAAFPYDGQRWRGPGLPCVGDAPDAMAHAARCVAPLDADDSEPE